MIKLFIVSILLICSNAFTRPLDAKIAQEDIPVLQELLSRICKEEKLSANNYTQIRHYLQHSNRLLVALAATSIEFLGSEGDIFLEELQTLSVSDSDFIKAHVLLALNAIEVSEKSRRDKLGSLLELPYIENDYLCLQIIERLYLDGDYESYADQMLNDLLSKTESKAYPYATKVAWKWDMKRGVAPRMTMPIPADTVYESTWAKTIDASGGLEKSSYFNSGLSGEVIQDLSSREESVGGNIVCSKGAVNDLNKSKKSLTHPGTKDKNNKLYGLMVVVFCILAFSVCIYFLSKSVSKGRRKAGAKSAH